MRKVTQRGGYVCVGGEWSGSLDRVASGGLIESGKEISFRRVKLKGRKGGVEGGLRCGGK